MAVGQIIGPYTVVGKLGAGGMGEVYRAKDSKLKRDVALKVLPADVANDRERLARFQREAEVLASLNHPHIAHIHGLEESNGTIALVMELVEGEDLAQRIARGPIPLDEAMPIARQIAEALEAAHEQGIIHRDLKPANVKVRPDGTVKVLDFGLAKAMLPPHESGIRSNVTHSPTMTSPAMTAMGLILGTAAYMSPEQARGRAVDKRADIWAFGVVLFEMLSGTRAFQGDDVSDLLVAVLSKDVDLGALPRDTPRFVVKLIQSCLERDPKNRLRDIGDARLVIGAGRGEDAAAMPGETAAAPGTPWRRLLPWSLATLGLVVGALAAAGALTRPGPGALPVSRWVIPLPADAPFFVHSYPGRSLALSRDGTAIAYTTRDSVADTRIRVRRLDDIEIRSIPGTERARAPFFSPDGGWLAYFDWAENALKKISMRGGPPVTLQRGFANAGWMLATWCDDGRIVTDTWNGGLRVMSGQGGDMQVLTQPTDEWHLDPQALPGGCRVLFYTHRTEGQRIEAISADGGGRTRILDHASHGRYLASGHLLFVRDDALYIVPFDAGRLKVTGAAIPLPIEAVPDWFGVGAPNPQLAVSRNGTLVYAPRDQQAGDESMLVSVTHDGQTEDLVASPFPYPSLALAPNGEQLAFAGRRVGNARIDVLDLRRKATTSLADLGAVDYPGQAVWAPDGKALYYTRYGPFEGEVMRHVMDGRVPDEVLVRLPGTWLCAWSISPDGRWLIISRYATESQADLLRVDLEAAPGTAAVTPLVATPAEESGAAISPDGERFAYASNKGNDVEVLVEKFPGGGQKTRVAASADGVPIWSHDGREIYFRSAGRGTDDLTVMAARITTTPAFHVSEPRQLFTGRFLRGRDMGRSMILAPDGRRFLMIRTPPRPSVSGGTGYASHLFVVQNWFEDLKAKVLK